MYGVRVVVVKFYFLSFFSELVVGYVPEQNLCANTWRSCPEHLLCWISPRIAHNFDWFRGWYVKKLVVFWHRLFYSGGSKSIIPIHVLSRPCCHKESIIYSTMIAKFDCKIMWSCFHWLVEIICVTWTCAHVL